MRIGFHVVDSTPRVGTYLGGFARLRNSNGVRDRLRAAAMVVESDQVAVVLALDLVFAHDVFVDRVRDAIRHALGRDDVAVTVACSHSHATPYGTADAPRRRFQDYAERLVGLCAQAARSAWDARVEGGLRFGSADTDIGVNRRLVGDDGLVDFGWNESGPYDAGVRVLEGVAASGERLGVLVNHGCHPICLPPWSRKVSADWVGEMRRAAEKELGAPCLFVQGACADVNPRHEWLPRRWGKNDIRGPHAADSDGGACEVLGGRVAQAAIAAVAAAETVDDGPIRHAARAVAMELVPEPGAAPGEDLPYWRGVIRDAPLPRWLVDRLLQRAFPWQTEVARDGATPTVPLQVQSVRIGGFALAAHGSEAFCETGLDTLARSPSRHTFFAGYANGMIGYVPPPEEIPLRGYEVDTVPYLYRLPGRFAPTAEPTARDATAEQLASLFATN